MTAKDSIFLDEAVAIGDHLINTAILWRGHANWAARQVPERVTHDRPKLRDPHAQRLGHSLYDGVTGPALFLTHLSRFNKDPRTMEVAHAAVSEALRLSERLLESSRRKVDPKHGHPGRSRLGFYSGAMGPIWIAHEAAILLGDPFLAAKAKGLLDLLFEEPEGKLMTDLMAGHAGAIPALVSLHRDHGDGKALQVAIVLGEQLAELAVREGDTISWEGEKDWKRNLTGFTHGAAGYAYGLGHLYAATGKSEFQELAEGAIRYERQHFDEKQGNWPDFRFPPKNGDAHRCCSIWCHGAGGIGLSRFSLHPILKDDGLLDETNVARQRTKEVTAYMLDYPGFNYMYCHGVAGNAECLWMIEEGLGHENALGRARNVGRIGIERFGVQVRTKARSAFVQWPTGIPGYPEISMFKGISGIGYFFLRLHAPEVVPSILLPGVSHRKTAERGVPA